MKLTKTIFGISVFLLAAPLWTPHMQALGDHNLFLNPDALFVAGLTFLVALLCSFLNLKFPIQKIKKISDSIKKHPTLVLSSIFVIVLMSAYLANKLILVSFMNSGDEHSCYFLAECIRSGSFWAQPHPLSDFFEVVHVGNKAGKWFSVYPPGWPLIWALALSMNLGNWINPIMAAVATTIFLKIGERVYGFSSSVLAIVLLITSPFYILNNASYYSHTTCLLMVAIFLYAFLQWQEKPRLCWYVLGAFVLGYGLGTRYLTMASIAIPFILFETLQVVRRKKAFTAGHVWFWLITLFMLSLQLYYNYLISGNPLDAPNHYYHRWERLGFYQNYTVIDAAVFVLARILYLMDWFTPAAVLIYLISLFSMWKVLTTLQKLFHFSLVYLALGYVFYYSWGGNQYGPRYYFEAFPLAVIGIAHMIRLWLADSERKRKVFAAGLVIMMTMGNTYLFSKQAHNFAKISRERKALYDLAEKQLDKPSIVFVHGFLGNQLIMSEVDAIRNHPKLNSKILYAHDLGQRNKELVDYYPNRSFYRAQYDREDKAAKIEKIGIPSSATNQNKGEFLI